MRLPVFRSTIRRRRPRSSFLWMSRGASTLGINRSSSIGRFSCGGCEASGPSSPIGPTVGVVEAARAPSLVRVSSASATRDLTAPTRRYGSVRDNDAWISPDACLSLYTLFPNWTKFDELQSQQELRYALSSDALHVPTTDIRAGLSKIRVVSARTGRRLHITPQRFRYTLGSRAAREGYGVMVIAELLDHSDVQNASVYTRDHPNARKWLDKAVGRQLAPLAHAFAGTVVDTELDARHGHDPTMRVGTRDQKVGTCGSRGWCGAQATACYTCMHFQPWVDAPHDDVLAWMLERRQQTIDAGASEAVATAFDPSIQAAEAVIAACKARTAELRGVRR